MGQKVNPYGFRLGITTDWKSRWFKERGYKELVIEDWKIRDYHTKQLESAAVSRIEIADALTFTLLVRALLLVAVVLKLSV